MQDENFYYIRKPHHIPSSFGGEYSFLEQLFDGSTINIPSEFIKNQQTQFTKEDEFGLLNRLDNETAGLLYFAKTPAIKQQYKELQNNNLIKKTYIADVQGKVGFTNKEITYPIAHHKHLKEKMVAITSPKIESKIRGKSHNLITNIETLYYDESKNSTTLLITISKGIRHQIRLHLSSIGLPILGDKLYGGKEDINLHLWCIGLTT